MINKEIIFEKLTPLENSDIGIYESAIDFAFEQRDIRNIAISGAYGAGKSSVLSAYKNKHNDKRFIHISLAHFQMQAVNSDEETSVKENGLMSHLEKRNHISLILFYFSDYYRFSRALC